MCASSVVGVGKMSRQSRNSADDRAFTTWPESGSLTTGFSPMMIMALSLPSCKPCIISMAVRPRKGDRERPQAASNFRRAFSSSTNW